MGPHPLSGVDAIREDLRRHSGATEIGTIRGWLRGASGTGLVHLAHCSTDGPRQGAVVDVRISGPRRENQRRAHTSEQFTKSVSQFDFMVVQFTVWEFELESISRQDSQSIEGSMPFIVANLGDVIRIRSRGNRMPARVPVSGDDNCDRDTPFHLLGHDETASDGLIILVGGHNQRPPRKQVGSGTSSHHGLCPAPERPDRRSREERGDVSPRSQQVGAKDQTLLAEVRQSGPLGPTHCLPVNPPRIEVIVRRLVRRRSRYSLDPPRQQALSAYFLVAAFKTVL